MDENQDLDRRQEMPEAEQEAGQYVPDANIDEEEEVGAGKDRSRKWWITGVVVVVFLAAAAFFGARLLNPPAQTSGGMGGGPSFAVSKGGPGGAKSVRVDLTPAKELPADQPATSGLFVRREDQSLYLGTGNVQIMVKRGPDSQGDGGEVSGKYDGPVVEVVVTHDTQIYEDMTDMLAVDPEQSVNGSVSVQQEVKPGSLDDIGKNSMVTVWGEKRGDRFLAKVLLFR